MGLNFRKSISLGNGLKLNLSKSGPSLSFGKSGMRQSVNLKGQARTTIGVPGTGVYYTKTSNVKNLFGGKDKNTAAKGAGTKAHHQRARCSALHIAEPFIYNRYDGTE